jgi:predicted glycosyltransferase
MFMLTKDQKTIWIDLDNTPHVLFFRPIIDELRGRGFTILLTARDAFQVCELADKYGLNYLRIGRHYGKNRVLKVLGLCYRAVQLYSIARRSHPVLAVSHGARSQVICANILRIPSVVIEDYEFTEFPFLMRPLWRMAPDLITASAIPCRPDRLISYPGLKEDVYVHRFTPDPKLRGELGIPESAVMVTARPPATEAYYHNARSDTVFASAVDFVLQHENAHVILLPRNVNQAAQLKREKISWFESGRVKIPVSALDGPNLIWNSDLVISGGGTMNREACVLGVPVYSTFAGSLGAVDLELKVSGRLVILTDLKRIPQDLRVIRREKTNQVSEFRGEHDTTVFIVKSICALANHPEQKNSADR